MCRRIGFKGLKYLRKVLNIYLRNKDVFKLFYLISFLYLKICFLLIYFIFLLNSLLFIKLNVSM